MVLEPLDMEQVELAFYIYEEALFLFQAFTSLLPQDTEDITF